MAVDSALKRFSATNLIVPSMVGTFPGTAGISAAERQAIVWVYSGILASAPSAALVQMAFVVKGTNKSFIIETTEKGFTIKTTDKGFKVS